MGAEAFKAARDFLFAHRTDYKTAHTEFRWPQLTHFNYAFDWFDAELARGATANQPALKIVAVFIPATTLLTRNDLKDRFERGRVRHLIANAADAAKFDGLDPTVKRIALGEAPSGWTSYASLSRASPSFTPDAPTNAADPMLLYFTSGTTSRPKLVEHSHQSYPVGHLITMYWLGLQLGDMHLNISSPGWAKHAYSCFFCTLEC